MIGLDVFFCVSVLLVMAASKKHLNIVLARYFEKKIDFVFCQKIKIRG
jgi:hypothetical protein